MYFSDCKTKRPWPNKERELGVLLGSFWIVIQKNHWWYSTCYGFGNLPRIDAGLSAANNGGFLPDKLHETDVK